MNKHILTLSAAFIGLSLQAVEITTEQALARVATSTSQKALYSSLNNIEILETGRFSNRNTYYIANVGNKTLILSADDAASPILATLDNQITSASQLPEAARSWISDLSEQIASEAPFRSSYEKEMATVNTGKTRYTGGDVRPLISTLWGQGSPYNNMAPLVDGKKPAAGCVPVALAQVFKVMEHPDSGTGVKTITAGGKEYTRDLSQSTYQWQLMDDWYDENDSSPFADAAAQLVSDIGFAAEVCYGTSTGTDTWHYVRALVNNFKFDKGLDYYERSWYSDEDWKAKLLNEIGNNRPVIYGAVTEDNGGHLFVLDGYQTDTDSWHLVWGWNGYADGFYRLNAFAPINTPFVFSKAHGAVFDLIPENEDAPTPAAPLFVSHASTTGKLDGNFLQINWPGWDCVNSSMHYDTDEDTFFGIRMVDQSTQEKVFEQTLAGGKIKSQSRISYLFAILPDNLADGVYECYPVYKPDSSQETHKIIDRTGTKSSVTVYRYDGQYYLNEDDFDTTAIESVQSEKAKNEKVYYNAWGRKVKPGEGSQSIYFSPTRSKGKTL